MYFSMSQRIVINKNILHKEPGDNEPLLLTFSHLYPKKEIVIDNTKGNEGLWIMNEEGDYKHISLNPLIISGLSESQVQDIARNLILNDLGDNFARTSQLGEVSGRLDEVSGSVETLSGSVETLSGSVETLSGALETVSEHVDDKQEELENYVDERLSQLDIAQLIGISQEDLDRITAVVALINSDESIRDALVSHVALTREQYDELLANNEVVIDGKTYHYNSRTYYNIYETDEGSDEDSYEYDEETGMLTILGDASIDEDGMVEVSAMVDSDGYITVNGGESEDEEIVVDDNGLIEVSDEQIDEDGFINIPNSWEIM